MSDEIIDPETQQILDEQEEDKFKEPELEDLTIKQIQKKYGVNPKRGESKAQLCQRLNIAYSDKRGGNKWPSPDPRTGTHLKLTPELINRFKVMANPHNKSQTELFFEAVQDGLPLGLACEAAGISRETLRVWRNEVQDDEENGEVRNPDLHEVIKMARMIQANNYRSWMRKMETIADGEAPKGANGFLYCWKLERREPDYFSQKTKDNKTNIIIDQSGNATLERAHELANTYDNKQQQPEQHPQQPKQITVSGHKIESVTTPQH